MTIEELKELNNSKNKESKHHDDPEHQLQVECVNYFRLKYRNARIFAIPNGGDRNVKVAVKLKKEGVTKGVPDLQIAAARNGYHGLFIEMKNGKKGRLSKEQEDFIDYLIKEGYKCEVVRNIDEFMAVTKEYFGY